MGISVVPAPSAASKTMFRTTLTSGTSYTVPAGVTYLNVLLVGGGGSGCQEFFQDRQNNWGKPGETIWSTLSVTAGATIAYAIGAGGAATTANGPGNNGGTTTFTGATSATGGNGAVRSNGDPENASKLSFAYNGGAGQGSAAASGAGGPGCIIVEYWA
jgi:hypothetical protein